MDIVVNYIGVLAASVASFAVGALWYTVLFGKRWRALMGIPEGGTGASMAMTMMYGFLLTLLTSYVLAHFMVLSGVVNVWGAVTLCFWVWVGFQAPILANSVLYEGRPVELYLINATHQLVAVLVAGAVLSLF